MAEAMSRHCSETDIYHFGPMKGIGSRHNVRHWGCSCKEPRISMAGHHRPMFYLTGDRRLGDVLDEVVSAAESLDNLYFYHDDKGEFSRPNARTGPDWSSFVSDWMTDYERHLNETSRSKIERGIDDNDITPMGVKLAALKRYADMVDVFCGNYMEHYYEKMREYGIRKPIIGTEVQMFYRKDEQALNNVQFTRENPYAIVKKYDWVCGSIL